MTLLEGTPTEVVEKLNNDAAYVYAKPFIDDFYTNIETEFQEKNSAINTLKTEYMKALMEVVPNERYYPDANSTLRVTYGQVRGYEPRDAVYYNPVSYLDGVMEKYVPGDYEFDVPQKLQDLYTTKDYGRYADKNGKLPVCFLGTNHTTGGNSGSPAIDAEGNLVGLNFCEHLGIENEAIKNYHSALKLHTQEDTTAVYISNKIGAIHLSLKQYKNAIKYLNKSLNITEQINFEKGKATSYALLGSVSEKESDYVLALQNQEKSLAIFKKLCDSTGLAFTYENIGSIYEDLDLFDKALNYFLKANTYANHIPSDNRINIINNIGDAHRKKGHPKDALPYTLKALQMAEATKNTHQIEAAIKDLALNYADLGDHENAFNYMINYKDLNANESEYKNSELVSILQILYDVEERESEVKLLNKQHELNQVSQRIILLSSTFLILMLIGWFLYFRKRKKQQSKIQDYKNRLLESNLEKKTNEEAALQREIDFKISALTNYSLHLSHKNKMISDISRTLTNIKDRNTVLIKSKLETLIKEIDLDLSQEQEWTEFIGFFEQIHPNFFHTLKNSATKELSPSELRLCMLLRLNLSSKKIASILRITPDSVRIARYRLRKKLPINPKDDLQIFILNL